VGREPVGNGHLAAGFSEDLIPGVAAVEGGGGVAGAVAADFLAGALAGAAFLTGTLAGAAALAGASFLTGVLDVAADFLAGAA